jgi:hypothetical protein
MTHTVVLHIGYKPTLPLNSILFDSTTDWDDPTIYHSIIYKQNVHIQIPYGYNLPSFVRPFVHRVILYTTSISSHVKWLYEYYGFHIAPNYDTFYSMLQQKDTLEVLI